MKKDVNRLLALGLAGMMALGLAACGSDGDGQTDTPASDAETKAADTGTETEETAEPADSGEKTTITISSYLTSDAQLEPFNEYIVGAIEKQFPNVDFEVEIFSDRQNVMVEVAGGGGPDILDLDGPTDVVEFAEAGKVVDMTPYAEQYGWQDIVSEWAYNTCIYKDKLYSLPTAYEGMGIYYNLDVMEEHGWEIPQNLEEMEAWMEEAHNAGIMPIAFGNANYQGAVDHLYSTMLSCMAGPDVVKQAINGEIPFDDPRMVEPIAKFKEWFDKGYITDGASQTITQDDQMAFMADGRAAAVITGTWSATYMVQTFPDVNWTFQLFPVLNEDVGQIFPLAVGGSYAISANSENPDLCAEILNFLYTDMDTFYAAVNSTAIQPFAIEAFDYTKMEGMDEKVVATYEVMSEASAENRIGYCAWCFFPADARTYMNENFDAVLLGSLSPEDYMKNTQEYIDASLADGTTPVLP